MHTAEKQRSEKHSRKMEDRIVRQPISAQERAKYERQKPEHHCFRCKFCVSDRTLWVRTLASGFPATGQCANHADMPGRWRPVPVQPCRNYRPKPFRTDPPQSPDDSIRYIPLTRGMHAIVDAEDHEWLGRHKWQVQPSANHRTHYAKRVYRGRLILMHRQIMKPPKGMFIDHINGNGLDNRRCNLRICTPGQNSCNRSKQRHAKHRFIGVQPCGKNTYQAIIMHKGKTHRGGTFTDEIEAAKARDRLALQLHGPFARLNFPERRHA